MHIRKSTRSPLNRARGGTSRREFVKSGAAPLMAAAIAPAVLASPTEGADQGGAGQAGRGQRLLLKGGIVLSWPVSRTFLLS